ncbi:unnamed protein product [Rhizopus stolonifer]
MFLQNLSNYISKSATPKLSVFVKMHQDQIVVNATQSGNLDSPEDLYSNLKKAFLTEAKKQGKAMQVSNTGYNKKLWVSLYDLMTATEVATMKIKEQAVQSIGQAAKSAGHLIQDAFEQNGQDAQDENAPMQDTTQRDVHDQDLHLPHEIMLHKITHKKLARQLISDEETAFATALSKVVGQTLKEKLHVIAAKKLVQTNVKDNDEEQIKLCVSGIANMIHPDMSSEIMDVIGPHDTLDFPSIMNELEPSVSKSFDDLVTVQDNSEDNHKDNDESNVVLNTDSVLLKILLKKADLLNQKKTKSQEFVMLNIVEEAMKNFGLWRPQKDESETTFYRRFATLLDTLFKDTDILLADGETAALATKTMIDLNKATNMGLKLDQTNGNERKHRYPSKCHSSQKI